jgi:hypothetical protein
MAVPTWISFTVLVLILLKTIARTMMPDSAQSSGLRISRTRARNSETQGVGLSVILPAYPAATFDKLTSGAAGFRVASFSGALHPTSFDQPEKSQTIKPEQGRNLLTFSHAE